MFSFTVVRSGRAGERRKRVAACARGVRASRTESLRGAFNLQVRPLHVSRGSQRRLPSFQLRPASLRVEVSAVRAQQALLDRLDAQLGVVALEEHQRVDRLEGHHAPGSSSETGARRSADSPSAGETLRVLTHPSSNMGALVVRYRAAPDFSAITLRPQSAEERRASEAGLSSHRPVLPSRRIVVKTLDRWLEHRAQSSGSLCRARHAACSRLSRQRCA